MMSPLRNRKLDYMIRKACKILFLKITLDKWEEIWYNRSVQNVFVWNENREGDDRLNQEGAIRRELPDPENVYWAFAKLMDVSKYFRAYCYRSVVDLGFSLNEIDVLMSLRQHPERNTVKGISETVHLSKGMISQAVESLRRKDFVTVGHDTNDRRSVLITLTGMAQPVLERLKEASATFVQKIVSGIPLEQLREGLGMVTQVYSNKEKMKNTDILNESEN